jgi:hypothetical protein
VQEEVFAVFKGQAKSDGLLHGMPLSLSLSLSTHTHGLLHGMPLSLSLSLHTHTHGLLHGMPYRFLFFFFFWKECRYIYTHI